MDGCFAAACSTPDAFGKFERTSESGISFGSSVCLQSSLLLCSCSNLSWTVFKVEMFSLPLEFVLHGWDFVFQRKLDCQIVFIILSLSSCGTHAFPDS